MNNKENLKNYILLLESKRETIFNYLNKYSDAELNNEYILNKWTINQNLYHLWLAEFSTEKYIRKKTSYPEYLKNVTFFTGFNHIFSKYLIRLDILKFKAPEIISKFPDKININLLNNNWIKSRESFLSLIDDLDDSIIEKGIFNHHAIGRINLRMTLDFFNFHFNHHVKKINKISILI
jgi:hypothetical protein